tara:strand:+ start:3049 stop:3246 length:198 start_codon:yes stop_codon:yes gene_type:complete
MDAQFASTKPLSVVVAVVDAVPVAEAAGTEEVVAAVAGNSTSVHFGALPGSKAAKKNITQIAAEP